MTAYTCQTCAFAAENPEMGKHLSSTRHRGLKFDAADEVVACEECNDSNIHQLLLLRYGLSDMALLCQLCMPKDEAASTQYSLSNGSLLKKLPQYFTFRDIECEDCHADAHLFVGNEKKQHIFCSKCLPEQQKKYPKTVFVSEDSEKFLFELLGIKEHVPPSAKARARKLGRKGGRFSRKPKSDDPAAAERRAHYEATKANNHAIKSGKTVLAVGSGPVTPTGHSRASTPRSGTSSGEKKSFKDKGKTSTKSSHIVAPKPVPGKKSQPMHKTATKPPRNGETVKENGHGRGKGDSAKGSNKGSERKPLPDPREALNKLDGREKGNKKGSGPLKSKTSKDSVSKPTSGPKPTPKGPQKCSEELVLPPSITKLESAPSPPLRFPSMEAYFKELSYNLFLEEKASMTASDNSILTPEEMAIEWYADQDKKHKQFKVRVLLTDDIVNRFISKKMQGVKKTPFAINQVVFLILNDEIPWYGHIVTSDAKNATRSKSKNALKVMEMVIELYPWNSNPLPISLNVKWLKLFPASVPVSRVFMAMLRIENPTFIKMILGNEPIRQIVFKNYLKFTKDTFNDSQKVAVQSVLNNYITVLQGPPGTGKTSTIYEIILQLIENLNTFPILVVAASNIAIDNIAEKLLEKHGREILRITSLEKEKDYSRDHPLASICLHHKVQDTMPAKLKQTLTNLRNPFAPKISQNQYKKLMTQMIDISDTHIAQAKIIFTTTVVAGGNQLKSIKKLPVVIMDEATQSSEATTLIPLSMPGVDKFVFVGDQKQLGSFSQIPNLSLSLFERVLLNGTYRTPHMLDTQYRMHPAISSFPKKRFYNDLLKDGISADDRRMEGIPQNPVYFWDTCGKHVEGRVRSGFREDRGFTYANSGEIGFIEKVLINLVFEKGIPKSDIGVITPYRGQRDLISSALVKNELINPEKNEVLVEVDRDDIYNESKPVTIHMVSGIMIASIDAFQGREKSFLIMSCVRSNKESKIGFLSDERRLNVALTRAKYGLVLIGDAACLKKGDPLWSEYLTSLEDNACIHRETDFLY